MHTEPTGAFHPIVPSKSRTRKVLRTMFRDFFRFLLVVGAGTGVVMGLVVPKLETWQADAEADADARTEQVLRALQDIEDGVMVPPNNDKLFTILSKGLGITEDVFQTSTVGVAPAAAFVTDLTVVQQTDSYTQEILVQNNHATQILCVRPIAWTAPGATCTLKCAASGYTCSGAATDGWHLQSGQAMEFRWDGTNCVCLMGSGAGTNFQDRRAIR